MKSKTGDYILTLAFILLMTGAVLYLFGLTAPTGSYEITKIHVVSIEKTATNDCITRGYVINDYAWVKENVAFRIGTCQNLTPNEEYYMKRFNTNFGYTVRGELSNNMSELR